MLSHTESLTSAGYHKERFASQAARKMRASSRWNMIVVLRRHGFLKHGALAFFNDVRKR